MIKQGLTRQRGAAVETINFDALFPQPDRHQNYRHGPDGELAGQLSIDDVPYKNRLTRAG